MKIISLLALFALTSCVTTTLPNGSVSSSPDALSVEKLSVFGKLVFDAFVPTPDPLVVPTK